MESESDCFLIMFYNKYNNIFIRALEVLINLFYDKNISALNHFVGTGLLYLILVTSATLYIHSLSPSIFKYLMNIQN